MNSILTFCGAAGEVTGSCTHLATDRADVVIDLGMFQGGRLEEERNRVRPPVDFRRVEAVVLTHAHLDHCGRLPLLARWGYRGRIHATPATRDLCRIILADAAKLAERDAQRRTRRRRRRGMDDVAPLYGSEDVERILDRFEPLPYGEGRQLAPGVGLEFHDAGHILGSAMAELTVEQDGRTSRIVMSGDLGKSGSPILRDPTVLERADLVVMESTYGDREHRSTEETLAEFADILESARTPRGKVLIPAFAVGRSQEILYRLAEFRRQGRFSGVPVFLDSPMAIKATELYCRHTELFDEQAAALLASGEAAIRFDDLRYSQTVEDSSAINDMGDGTVVIAGSGMMTGGRILHHLKHNLWRRDVHLVIPGFQAAGSLGRRLVDGADAIRVLGEEVVVRARVHTLGGFSAHAGQSGLLEWARGFAPSRPRFILNHGEDAPRRALARRIEDELGFAVECPELGETVRLEAGR